MPTNIPDSCSAKSPSLIDKVENVKAKLNDCHAIMNKIYSNPEAPSEEVEKEPMCQIEALSYSLSKCVRLSSELVSRLDKLLGEF